ncbi:E3 ubiquitin-protein ligase TOM1-like [Astathelohania contejeani]|uniref:E3 ubiquitin-protein ligase TOM1-like n=1 Tax=Astathelohania contejeani TaxID=164912 RepID=A0ABQ7HZK3_9MICR|nr:E3 ubiquitin-protein ligase TOM1-like [Thelohania contejeani]
MKVIKLAVVFCFQTIEASNVLSLPRPRYNIKKWYQIFYKNINEENTKHIEFNINENDIFKETLDYFDSFKENGMLLKNYNLNIRFYNLKKYCNESDYTDWWLTTMALEFRKKKRLLFSCINRKNNMFEPNIFSKNALGTRISTELKAFGNIIGLIIKRERYLPFKLTKYFFQILCNEKIRDKNLSHKKNSSFEYSQMRKVNINGTCNFEFEIPFFDLNDKKDLFVNHYVITNNIPKYSFNYARSHILKLKFENLTQVIDKIKLGIYEVIDDKYLNRLTSRTFENLINGSGISIHKDYWLENCLCLVEDKNTNAIRWFWKYIKNCNHDKVKTIFFLLTGHEYMPLNNYRKPNIHINISLIDDIKCNFLPFSKHLFLSKTLNEKEFILSLENIFFIANEKNEYDNSY